MAICYLSAEVDILIEYNLPYNLMLFIQSTYGHNAGELLCFYNWNPRTTCSCCSCNCGEQQLQLWHAADAKV